MFKPRAFYAVITAVLIVAGACGSDSDAGSTTSELPATVESETLPPADDDVQPTGRDRSAELVGRWEVANYQLPDGGGLVAGVTGGTIIGYLLLLLCSLGASGLTMGLALAIATVSEVIAFSSAGRIVGRLGIGRTILLGSVAGGLRLLIYGVAPSVGWVLATQLLHGFTLSLPLTAGMMGAAKLSPRGLGTTGQGVLSAVFLGLDRPSAWSWPGISSTSVRNHR